MWGGEVNDRRIVSALRLNAVAALNPSVFGQAGCPPQSQGLSLLLTVGFYSFCYLLALGLAALP